MSVHLSQLPGSVQSPEQRRWGWWGYSPGRPWSVWSHCSVWWTRSLFAEKSLCSWCCCSSWWSTALMERLAETSALTPAAKETNWEKYHNSAEVHLNYWWLCWFIIIICLMLRLKWLWAGSQKHDTQMQMMCKCFPRNMSPAGHSRYSCCLVTFADHLLLTNLMCFPRSHSD